MGIQCHVDLDIIRSLEKHLWCRIGGHLARQSKRSTDRLDETTQYPGMAHTTMSRNERSTVRPVKISAAAIGTIHDAHDIPGTPIRNVDSQMTDAPVSNFFLNP